MIPTEKIIEEIKRVDSIVEGVPSTGELREHADVSYWAIHDRFGGIVSAREAAGVNGEGGTLCQNHPDVTDQEILEEVRRISNVVDRPPSVGDLKKYSEYEVGTMIYRFGGMRELRDAAGVMREYNHAGGREESEVLVKCENCGCEEYVFPARAETYTYCSRECMGLSNRKHTTSEIRTALEKLAEELEAAPSTRQFDQHTQFQHGLFEARDSLDSFSTELRRLGYEPRCPKDLSKNQLLQNLRDIEEKTGRPPREHDLAEFGHVNTAWAYVNRWGSWVEALEAAGIEPDNSQRTDIQRKELVKDFQRVADELGSPPGYNEIREYGRFSAATYERAFGSFLKAKEACGFEPTPKENKPSGEDHYAWKGGTKPHYGKSWREQREKAVERDQYTCQSCGITADEHLQDVGTDLHVHHITPWDEFDNHEERNKLSNLITLCASCHRTWENLPVKPQVTA